jgi:hypothetical protein
VPLEKSVSQYATIPSHVLAVTDHNHITDTADLQRRFPEILFLNGFEHSGERDMLFVGTRDESLTRLPLTDALQRKDGALTIICHPDVRPGADYWSMARMRALPARPDCVEVYNGHYSTERLRAKGGQPRYTHVWDALWSEGWRIWGVANDDFHDPEDFNNAFTMLCVAERRADAVIMAMKRGQCYASTGLLLRQLRVDGDVMSVETCQPCEGQFIGPMGAVLATGSGLHFRYPLKGEAYVRFEGRGEAGLLFAQPVFRLPDGCAPGSH